MSSLQKKCKSMNDTVLGVLVATTTLFIILFVLFVVLYATKKPKQTKCINAPLSLAVVRAASPFLSYTSSELQTQGQQVTGIALWFVSGQARPALLCSAGRHTLQDASCFAIFPSSVVLPPAPVPPPTAASAPAPAPSSSDDNDFPVFAEVAASPFSSPVALPAVQGSFSGVSVKAGYALFSGDGNESGVTPCTVYKLPEVFNPYALTLAWSQPSSMITYGAREPRSSCFGDNLDVVVGMTDGSVQIYSGPAWGTVRSVALPGSSVYCPVTYVSLSYNTSTGVLAAGGRIPWPSLQLDPSRTLVYPSVGGCTQLAESFVFGANYGTPTPVQTQMQAVGTFAGTVITPNDVVFVGSSDNAGAGSNRKAIPFLLKGANPAQRVNLLQTSICARAVAVYDISGNGLQDIFIVCELEPHRLLLQTSPGVFSEQQIPCEDEYRGITIGRVYNNPATVEVVLTSINGTSNIIYSFKQ